MLSPLLGPHSGPHRPLTISAVKQDLHALPERVDVLGFLYEGVPLLYQNTGGTSESRRRDPTAWLPGCEPPVPGWGCALETATLPPRPQRPALVLLPVPTSDPKPSPLRKQPHTHPGCSDGLPTCSLLLPLSAPMGNGHGAGSACPSRAPRPPEGREAGRTLPPGKQRLSPHLEDLTNPHASYIWGLVQPQPCGLPPNPQPAGLLHKTKASASVHSVTRVIICHYNYTVTSLIH